MLFWQKQRIHFRLTCRFRLWYYYNRRRQFVESVGLIRPGGTFFGLPSSFVRGDEARLHFSFQGKEK